VIARSHAPGGGGWGVTVCTFEDSCHYHTDRSILSCGWRLLYCAGKGGGGGGSQLALLRILAIITQIDGSMAASRKQGIRCSLASLGDDGNALFVTRHQHTYVVRHLDLQITNYSGNAHSKLLFQLRVVFQAKP
jgi:hypothetical protein